MQVWAQLKRNLSLLVASATTQSRSNLELRTMALRGSCRFRVFLTGIPHVTALLLFVADMRILTNSHICTVNN